MTGYASRSLWLETCGDPLVPRPPLEGPTGTDVAIVGGGFTGLWTAYYLGRTAPHLEVTVLERHVAGFGASGRNGGWCSALLPMSLDSLARRSGADEARRMQRTMFGTVDEVARVCAAEGIDAQIRRGGTLHLATRPAHVPRLRAEVDEARRWGFDEADHRWLGQDEARERIDVAGLLGAAYTPHCAAVQPARLVRGLAAVVERRGVRIAEGTTVTAIEPGVVRTDRGEVRAPVIVRATEGFTPALRGHRRTLLPVYSYLIATPPLEQSWWDRVGWQRGETVADGRNSVTYAQRTPDGRLVFGGRGAPYHLGSRVSPRFDRHRRVAARLRATVAELWPDLAGVEATHHWGGPLAAPRDWTCGVGLDRTTGLAWAGGYVGDGVATANLAGRTLADLVTGQPTPLTTLPWVGHRSPRWEPEPFRWLGVNAALLLPRLADAAERRTGRPARRTLAALGRLLDGS